MIFEVLFFQKLFIMEKSKHKKSGENSVMNPMYPLPGFKNYHLRANPVFIYPHPLIMLKHTSNVLSFHLPLFQYAFLKCKNFKKSL